MYRVALDTANPHLSFSMMQDGEIMTIVSDFENRHQEKLLEISSLLRNKKITDVLYSSGPGSYTGLRIGQSFIDGLCFDTSITIHAVSDLTAVASAHNVGDNAILVLKQCRPKRKPDEVVKFWYAYSDYQYKFLSYDQATISEIFDRIECKHLDEIITLNECNLELESCFNKLCKPIAKPISEYLINMNLDELDSEISSIQFSDFIPNYGSNYTALTINDRKKAIFRH